MLPEKPEGIVGVVAVAPPPPLNGLAIRPKLSGDEVVIFCSIHRGRQLPLGNRFSRG